MKIGRLGHIDGLRGIAATLVVLQHTSEFLHGIAPRGEFFTSIVRLVTWDWLNFGKIGVVAFFCISGFVIPFSFSGSRPLAKFLVSRFFRLYPMYWLSIAGAVFILPIVGIHAGLRQVLANITMVQAVFGQKDLLGVYWTLLIELVFYSFCFLACWRGVLRSPFYFAGMGLTFLAVALLMAVANNTLGKGLPIALALGLAVMHFGGLTRLAVVERDDRARRLMPYATVSLLVLAVIACLLGYSRDTALGGALPYVTSYVVAIVLFLCCAFFRIFSGRVLSFLGATSYALYLMHPLTALLAEHFGREVGWPLGAGVIIVIMATSFPIAWLAHKLVERPMAQLAKRVESLLERGPASPSKTVPSA